MYGGKKDLKKVNGHARLFRTRMEFITSTYPVQCYYFHDHGLTFKLQFYPDLDIGPQNDTRIEIID